MHTTTLHDHRVAEAAVRHRMPADVLRRKMDASPHFRYGNSNRRGYLLFDVKDDIVDVAVRALDTVSTHDSACLTERRFAVAEDHPGIAEA